MPLAEFTWRNHIYSRYRCRECLIQFWVISRKTYIAVSVLMVAILLAIIAVIAMEVAFDRDPPSDRRRSADLQYVKA